MGDISAWLGGLGWWGTLGGARVDITTCYHSAKTQSKASLHCPMRDECAIHVVHLDQQIASEVISRPSGKAISSSMYTYHSGQH